MSSIVPVSKTYSGFDPRTIPGCQLWLDAADTSSLTLSGSSVTQWRDKSGSGNNATTTLGTPVLQTLDGIQGIYFATETEQMTTVSNAATLGSAARTLICVIRAPTASSEVIIGCGSHTVGASPTSFGFHLEGPFSRLFAPYTYSTDNNLISFFSTATMIVYADYNAVANTVAGNYNGTSLQSRSTATLATTSTPWYLGRRPDANGCVTGYIYEVIHYSSVLTTTQRQQVEGYLASKWGIKTNLNAAHPFKIVPIYSQPFKPNDIDNCVLWMDGADNYTITTNVSNAITQINDKSISSNNNTIGTTSLRPTYINTFNKNNVITFDGVNNRVTLNSALLPTGTSPFSVFLVGRTTSGTAGTQAFLTWGNGAGLAGGSYQLASSNNVLIQDYKTVSSVGQSSDSTNILSNYFLFSQTATTTSQSNFLNGNPFSSQKTYSYNFSNSTIGLIGMSSNTTAPLTGDIGEVIIYNVSLEPAQRQQVEGYLANKWGLSSSLPSTHSYKLFPALTPLFSPLQVPTCTFWIDASDPSTITQSTGVSQWNDKSGNSYNLTQSTGSLQPSYSNNAVTFSSNKYLNVPQAAINNATRYSLFFVFTPISSTNWIMVKQHDGTNTYNVLSMGRYTSSIGANTTGTANYMYWKVNNAGTILNQSSPALTSSTMILVRIVYDGVNLYFYKNGALVNTIASTVSTIPNVTAATNYTMGVWIRASSIQNTGVTNFSMNEMLFFNTTLTNIQAQKIEGILASKWKLQSDLPSTHLYKRYVP